MCTLTIVPYEDGFQLGCNRDERLERPAALPPQVHLAGDLLAAFPIDIPGGGTWIGVNERGLVTAVLNRTIAGDRPAAATARCSRGTLARHVLAAEDLDHAVGRLMALPLRAFDPFTVVIAQGRSLGVVTSDGYQYAVTVQALDRPACFTSSSLGDALVLPPRLELFERAVARAREPLLMQSSFHAHQWTDRPHVSVNMRREGAATVSRTWISVSRDRACLTYEPLAGDSTALYPVFTELPCTNSPASSSRPS
jgi:uncharacterized protein with NRDE domain